MAERNVPSVPVGGSPESSAFSIGVEEEYQIVDPETGELKAHIQELLPQGRKLLGDHIKPEMLQSVVEATTEICNSVGEVRAEITRLRATMARMLAQAGLRMVAAGTHPLSHWQTQHITPSDRYKVLEENLQDVVRSILIFGLHVHISVPDPALLIDLMNDARYFLPHMLALSTNSPFWLGRLTGLKSYRTVVWQQFPRTGIPERFASWSEFDNYVNLLVKTNCIDNGRRIWWDLRPHPSFNTLEFRICDMPTTADETIALAALIQAVVAKLYKLRMQNLGFRMYSRALIEENKWRAARYGLDGKLIDFGKQQEVPMRDLAIELLDFVDDVVDGLGSRTELQTIRRIVQAGTGADHQIAVYAKTQSTRAVVDWLCDETVRGIGL
jgi:carboxylate-amine ligase